MGRSLSVDMYYGLPPFEFYIGEGEDIEVEDLLEGIDWLQTERGGWHYNETMIWVEGTKLDGLFGYLAVDPNDLIVPNGRGINDRILDVLCEKKIFKDRDYSFDSDDEEHDVPFTKEDIGWHVVGSYG